MASSRKISRRQSKYKNILRNELGMECQNVPSRCIMLCNAGLVCNIKREDVLQLFGNFGKVDTLIMLPAKSYCFLRYDRLDAAVESYDQLNGKAILPGQRTPLYLLYVDIIPKDVPSPRFNEFPPGLILVRDFVSECEERLLLDCILFDELDSANLGEMKHRSVKHYGYKFVYGRNDVDKDSPLDLKIPGECGIIFERFKERGLSSIIPWIPDQLTVNRYSPGQGIPSHIDTHSAFEDPILSLSLGASVVMDFKQGLDSISVDLPRRSLLIMSGESRYAWSHGICPRKTDVIPHPDDGLTIRPRETRTSFTFRKIKHSPCDCSFNIYCDSQIKQVDISEDIAPSLENSYVHQVYNKISGHFSCTRHKPWPKVLEFVKSFPPGSVLVDVGCGNGKYFGHSSNIVELGLDQCSNLIEICRDRGFEGLVGSCLCLPFKSNFADCVICVAVIHHLSTKSRRISAIKEMVRVARVGGKILIYAWAKNQKAHDTASSYLKQSRKNRRHNDSSSDDLKMTQNPVGTSEESDIRIQLEEMELDGVKSLVHPHLSLPLHENRTSFQHHDLLVPWKLKESPTSAPSETFLRFYHVFNDNELQDLCSCVDNVLVEKSYYDQGNWCVILKKV